MVNTNKYFPTSLDEALQILSEHDCYLLAGGTDLMVMKHRGSGLLPGFEKDVLFLNQIAELNVIKKIDNALYIGATVKYVDLLKSPIVPKLLKDIIIEIASPNIRNMASLTGNVGNASPAGDSLVGLYLLNAQVELTSLFEKRIMPIAEFIYGIRRIHRKSDELITGLIIPDVSFTKTYWKKVGSRQAESISKVTFAGAYTVKDGIIKDIRMAFGSVFTTVVRSLRIEKEIIGMSVSKFKGNIPHIVRQYSRLIKPITDQRSTKEYRHRVALNILTAFLESVC